MCDIAEELLFHWKKPNQRLCDSPRFPWTPLNALSLAPSHANSHQDFCLILVSYNFLLIFYFLSWAHQEYLMQCSHDTLSTILKSHPWLYLTPTHKTNTFPCPPLVKPQSLYLSSGLGPGEILHKTSPILLLYL